MIYRVDPLIDRRWGDLVARHPDSTVFHTRGWLEALRRTYDYEPIAYTTSPPHGELNNGLLFCRLASWVTGKRLVSLPFSDHCDPLLGNAESGRSLFEELRIERASWHWRYVEIRPRSSFPALQPCMGPSKTYCLHALDLSPDAEKLFAGFHSKCTKQKIRRAERERLVYREGRSLDMLKMFYRMVLMTRKRHRIPPQPFSWFRNLAECLGPAMQVRLALAGEIPVAGLVTLRFRNVLVAKYAGSDSQHRNLGGAQWLFWKAIQEAKTLGLQEFDLGRSEWDNPGLIAFKDRLGAKRFSVSYWRYPKPQAQTNPGVLRRPTEWVVSHVPLSMSALAGRALYRHVG